MNTNQLDRKRLANCREKLGITKQEAARRMNMSQPAYLRYESGERSPSIHVIQVMADVLATSVAFLTGQTDNPNPDSYLVKSDAEPEFFQLIEKYRNADENLKNRILAYINEVTNMTSSESNSGNNK